MNWRLSCEVAALLWKLGQVMAREGTAVPSGEKIRGHHFCQDHAGYIPFGLSVGEACHHRGPLSGVPLGG